MPVLMFQKIKLQCWRGGALRGATALEKEEEGGSTLWGTHSRTGYCEAPTLWGLWGGGPHCETGTVAHRRQSCPLPILIFCKGEVSKYNQVLHSNPLHWHNATIVNVISGGSSRVYFELVAPVGPKSNVQSISGNVAACQPYLWLRVSQKQLCGGGNVNP